MAAQEGRELLLAEADAQIVALIQALEEEDREGVLLGFEARRQATLEALGDGEDHPAEWLPRRARRLLPTLERQMESLPRFLRWTRLASGLVAPVVGITFLLGLATNALGPSRQISVLAVPILGLIAWNVAVLGLSALARWWPVGGLGWRPRPRSLEWLQGSARRLAERLSRGGGEEEPLRRSFLGRFLDTWLPADAPLAAGRIRRLLHLGALSALAGAVGGMYLRGLGLEYRATWESTFLGPAQVDTLLRFLLGPAAALLGGEVPRAAALQGASAAPIIHLYAVTAGLFAGLPRLLLILRQGWRLRRLGRRLPLAVPELYLRRLRSAVETAERRIEVIPYSYSPGAQGVDRLRGLLYDHFGPRAEVRLRPTLAYGDGEDELAASDAQLRLVLFTLAQTPEVEVHGELLGALAGRLPDGASLLAVVDQRPYRERLAGGAGAAGRLADRRRAWQRVGAEAGLRLLILDLGQDLPPAALGELAACLWPQNTAGGIDG